MQEKIFDLVCFGRAGVDLYGQQVGGRLEDMASFAKYVGGSPTNTAIGVARLGLKPAMLTRVGDEHMGRYIKQILDREGVDISHVITDPERLTPLVLLGIQDETRFPLIFYRENCADMALCEDDIDENLIASSRALLLSGTHLSTQTVAAASLKAIEYAKRHHAKIILDIDYRPNLWGLSGHNDGENRFIADGKVSEHLQSFLPHLDLIVGTEEEFHIAGGSDDTLQALAKVRSLSHATLVCKRGAMGCWVFEDAVDDWGIGIQGQGFKIEVFNVLGAGDAFMSGLLRGWLGGEDWPTSCSYANACGALAVSRHGCSPAIPSWQELNHFLTHGSDYLALRHDPQLNHMHRATNRPKRHTRLVAFAIDHRQQFIDWAKETGRSMADIGQFKQLALHAAMQETQAIPGSGFGMLIDDRTGRAALHSLSSTQGWVGRPIEVSGKFPLAFECSHDLVVHLQDWPLNQTVKVLCPYRMDDTAGIRSHHDRLIVQLDAACRHTGHEWLLEVITYRQGLPNVTDQVPAIMEHFYSLGVKPDWWKLEPYAKADYWQAVGQKIDAHDPYCQGVMVLGLDADLDTITQAFTQAALQPWVKGFAVGRTIFGQAAQDWLAQRIDDQQAVTMMRRKYRQLIDAWDQAQEKVR